MRLVGFQRAAEAAYALPPAEREAAFARLERMEGIRDERGERIRRLDADLVRARGYAALAALAETTLVSADMKRLYVTTSALDPVSRRDIATELVAPEPSATVPAAVARAADPDAVVVWCGEEHVRSAALVVHALAGVGLPLVVVARGTIPGAETQASFVPLEQGAAALARARVVIPAHNDEPADALAFAALGFRLAYPSSSGAMEYLRGARCTGPGSNATSRRPCWPRSARRRRGSTASRGRCPSRSRRARADRASRCACGWSWARRPRRAARIPSRGRRTRTSCAKVNPTTRLRHPGAQRRAGVSRSRRALGRRRGALGRGARRRAGADRGPGRRLRHRARRLRLDAARDARAPLARVAVATGVLAR